MITNFKIFENESSVIYRLGTENDLIDIKKITNKLRNELGFVMNVALKDAILHDELLVAELDNKVIGFIHFHKRKDGWNTIHELGVHPDYQKLGIGKKLFNMIPKPVRLKTTVDNLTANTFYKYQGMENIGTEKGKKRELNIWTKESVNEKLNNNIVKLIEKLRRAIKKQGAIDIKINTTYAGEPLFDNFSVEFVHKDNFIYLKDFVDNFFINPAIVNDDKRYWFVTFDVYYNNEEITDSLLRIFQSKNPKEQAKLEKNLKKYNI